jgi:hypothetical protein
MLTPNDSDECAWCMRPYGDHIGTKCEAKSTRFRQQGELRLREVPIGSVVRYYADKDHHDILSFKSNTTGKGVVCFHDTSNRSTLLGWRDHDGYHPTSKWSRSWASAVDVSRLDPRCEHGKWVSDDLFISHIVVLGKGSGTVVPSPTHNGMKCAVVVCGTFNNYAQPNQPDGTHICFSCRESGRRAS